MKLMGGALLGGALATLGFGREAEAAPCDTAAGETKCFGTCCPSGATCLNKGAGASCQCTATGAPPCGGTECCGEGQLCCGGVCTEPGEFCGFCGNVCPTGGDVPSECFSGQCVCPPGFQFTTVGCVCPAGFEFDPTTETCVAVQQPPQNCTQTGGLCTSKNECCNIGAKCQPSTATGQKVCVGGTPPA